MLNEVEKKYLSSPKLSIKINLVELNKDYKDNDIFYYYGKGLVISTITAETYIDKNYYNGDKLNKLLIDIFSCIDTIELILPEELCTIDIINKTFLALKCKTLIIEGNKKINLNQLEAINNNTNISELKAQEIEKNIGDNKLGFKLIPNVSRKLTSQKFSDFLIDDILRLKSLNLELPLKPDYIVEENREISETKDLDKIIEILVDIDSLSLLILDDGSESIPQSLEIIDKINKSIGSPVENIYYVTGNRNIKNIDKLKQLEENHKVSIMYDKKIICSIDDFIKMRIFINKIVDPIKKVELSPLERTMYAYDIVKDFYIINNKYIKEKKVSNYIHRIFKTNELNCQAYAALYAQVLRELKIQATDYSLYSPLVEEIFLTKDNHARTMIHLVDKKYSIDGLFSADVVWDALKKTKGSYHYEFFLTRILNTKKQFSTDKFHSEIDLLLGNKQLTELSEKELQTFERLLNKNVVNQEDINKLQTILENNISLKIFLYSLSAVRVAEGRDKKDIKDELVAVVNRNNKKEKYKDQFYNASDDISYLDINKNL